MHKHIQGIQEFIHIAVDTIKEVVSSNSFLLQFNNIGHFVDLSSFFGNLSPPKSLSGYDGLFSRLISNAKVFSLNYFYIFVVVNFIAMLFAPAAIISGFFILHLIVWILLLYMMFRHTASPLKFQYNNSIFIILITIIFTSATWYYGIQKGGLKDLVEVELLGGVFCIGHALMKSVSESDSSKMGKED